MVATAETKPITLFAPGKGVAKDAYGRTMSYLRISLTEGGSRWAGAVEAVTATLPPLRGDEMDAVRRLAAEGPPAGTPGSAR